MALQAEVTDQNRPQHDEDIKLFSPTQIRTDIRESKMSKVAPQETAIAPSTDKLTVENLQSVAGSWCPCPPDTETVASTCRSGSGQAGKTTVPAQERLSTIPLSAHELTMANLEKVEDASMSTTSSTALSAASSDTVRARSEKSLHDVKELTSDISPVSNTPDAVYGVVKLTKENSEHVEDDTVLLNKTVAGTTDKVPHEDSKGSFEETIVAVDDETAAITNGIKHVRLDKPEDAEAPTEMQGDLSDRQAVVEDETNASMEIEVAEVPRKKKRKSKKKKGANNPSGFEEYYVDPPVTPAEYSLERILYEPAKPFTERIQTAIQRYSARRKFDEVRRHVWTKWLAYGGFDTGPKMFGGFGGIASIPVDATKEDIEAARATEFLQEDLLERGETDFVVDFEGVLKGFL